MEIISIVKIFKHLTSWDISKLELNKEYSTPVNESHYWKSKVQGLDLIHIKNSWSDLIKKINDMLPVRFEGFDQVGELLQESKFRTELLKEYIFEDIRRNEFNGNPSRKECMFCFPDDYDITTIREQFNFKKESRSVCLRVGLDENNSSSLLTDASYLDCNSLPVNEIEQRARLYWEGCEKPQMPEILVRGQFKVIEIIEF